MQISQITYFPKAAYYLAAMSVTGAWTELNQSPASVIKSILKMQFRLRWLRDAIEYKRQA